MSISRLMKSKFEAAIIRARKRYPALEFWLNSDGTIQVLGGKPGYKSTQIKAAVGRYLADQEFQLSPVQDTIIQPYSGTNTQIEKPASSWPLPGASASNVEKPPVAMSTPSTSRSIVLQSRRGGKGGRRPTNNRKGKQTARSRRYKLQNAALRPRKLPFRQVVDLKLNVGYFDHQFKIKDLIPELLNVYEEVRIISLSVVFLVNDAAVTAGLYTAILLDQNGYGTALKSSETWFKRVADMPGSVVHHATRGFRLTWKPTEPDSRNYVKVIDTNDIDKAIARIYVIGRESTLNVTGVLLIRGHVLARGQYYDASKLTVEMMKNLRLREILEEENREEDEEGASTGDNLSIVDLERES